MGSSGRAFPRFNALLSSRCAGANRQGSSLQLLHLLESAVASATLSNITDAQSKSVLILVGGEQFDLKRLRDPAQAEYFQGTLLQQINNEESHVASA